MLQWVGKKPLSTGPAYPAQHCEMCIRDRSTVAVKIIDMLGEEILVIGAV